MEQDSNIKCVISKILEMVTVSRIIAQDSKPKHFTWQEYLDLMKHSKI